ncbi:hypothetical protein E2C01_054633 [Portunus trituberculatus]|uniref:Uncharacterized protein n=1 Tax=Portunus trituberculatus TaxID=210409 RepID=A0A5B7GKE0_PORTR|nr:hypothetical protein [Portunus trituberculatus]
MKKGGIHISRTFAFVGPTFPLLIRVNEGQQYSRRKKLEIVKHHEGGEDANFITRTELLPQSTVSTLIKQAASAKKVVETASTLMAKMLMRKREPIIEEMERLTWLQDGKGRLAVSGAGSYINKSVRAGTATPHANATHEIVTK